MARTLLAEGETVGRYYVIRWWLYSDGYYRYEATGPGQGG